MIRLDDQAARIARSVVGSHTMQAADAANGALLDSPPSHGALYDASATTATTWSISYVRSTQAKYVELRVVMRASVTSGTVRIKLTLRDAAGNSVARTTSAVPDGFKDNTTTVTPSFLGGSVWTHATELRGLLDVGTIAATLTNASWSLDFEITTSSAHILSLHAVELPRWQLDDTASAGGILPGSFLPRRAVTDGAQDGLERLLATIESARTTQRTYLVTAWPQDITAAIPQTASTSYAALTNLAEAATYITWRVRARRLYAAATAGEDIRFRVLYRFAGGGVETADIRMSGNATGSPWAITGLAFTTTWTWSSWKDAKIVTNGTDTEDVFGFEARVSLATATFYLAGLHIQESST